VTSIGADRCTVRLITWSLANLVRHASHCLPGTWEISAARGGCETCKWHVDEDTECKCADLDSWFPSILPTCLVGSSQANSRFSVSLKYDIR
jgi:hypothetical protein